jgi:nitroreductase
VSNFDRDQPVPEISVLRALEAARWAPNHRLTEPWRFWWLVRCPLVDWLIRV